MFFFSNFDETMVQVADKYLFSGHEKKIDFKQFFRRKKPWKMANFLVLYRLIFMPLQLVYKIFIKSKFQLQVFCNKPVKFH